MRVWFWRAACLGWVVAAAWMVTTLPDSPLGLFGIPVCVWLARRCTRAARRARDDARAAVQAEATDRRREEQQQAWQQEQQAWRQRQQERQQERQARRDAEIAEVDEDRLIALVSGELPRLPLPTYRTLPADEWMHFLAPADYLQEVKAHAGELMVTNRGLYFTGDSGHEVTWGRIQGVDSVNDVLEVQTTIARGTLRYRFQSMTTLIYAWGTVHGGLQVANRLAAAVAEGERASRHIPDHVVSEVWRLDGARCRKCKSSTELQVDHIIPWSLNGSSKLGNLQLLCGPCNRAKSNRI